MNQRIEKNQVSWKKKIKYLNILFLILLILWYYVYWEFTQVYSDYKNTNIKLDNFSASYLKKQDNLNKIKTKTESLTDINKNSKKFIDAYNVCYLPYKSSFYSLWSWDSVSFRKCINSKYNKDYINNFTDLDLEKIGISMWVYKDTSKKISFDQSRFLASLDKNIFAGQLKNRVPLLSFSDPSLVDKNTNLYKVDFTFSVNLSYTNFINLFKLLQDRIFNKNSLYYTINSISSFDINDTTSIQKINVQWSFYLTKK